VGGSFGPGPLLRSVDRTTIVVLRPGGKQRVGWVEQRETHHVFGRDGFRCRSTHPIGFAHLLHRLIRSIGRMALRPRTGHWETRNFGGVHCRFRRASGGALDERGYRNICLGTSADQYPQAE
jgi:hypothetical protein